MYKFVCDPEALFNMAYGSSGNSSGAMATVVDNATSDNAGAHLVGDSHIIDDGIECRGDTSPATNPPEDVLAVTGMSPLHRHHQHQLYYNQHHYQQLQ